MPAAPSKNLGTWTARLETGAIEYKQASSAGRSRQIDDYANAPQLSVQPAGPKSASLWNSQSEAAKPRQTDTSDRDTRQRTPRSARERILQTSPPRQSGMPPTKDYRANSITQPRPDIRRAHTAPPERPEIYYTEYSSIRATNRYQPAQIYQVYHDRNMWSSKPLDLEKGAKHKPSDSGSITSIESAAQVEHDFHEHQQELSPVVESPPHSARSPVNYPWIPGRGVGVGVEGYGSSRQAVDDSCGSPRAREKRRPSKHETPPRATKVDSVHVLFLIATRTHVRLLRIYHPPFQILINPLPDVIPPPDHILSSVAFSIEQPGMGLLVFVSHPIVAADDLELGGHPVIWLQQSARRCLAQGQANPEGRGRGHDVSWP
jgi:hypothetical protein